MLPDRTDDVHFRIKVSPAFAPGENQSCTYTPQGACSAERIRNNAGTEMQAFTLPVQNQGQTGTSAYTVPHWRVAMPGSPIGGFWLFPEDVVPLWFTVPPGTVLPSIIVRQAIYAAAAVETGWVWYGRLGSGDWFRLTGTCETNPLCLTDDGVRAAATDGNMPLLTLDGRTFVEACSGYTQPNPDTTLSCVLTGPTEQAEQEASIRVASGTALGQTFQLKLCPDGTSDCSEVNVSTPLTLTVGPGMNARY
jgi:hypothetical protein